MSASSQMACPLTATQCPASLENRNSSISMEISAPHEASRELTVPVVLPKPDELHAKILTIRTSTSSGDPGEKSVPISPSISISPHLNSPSIISPPSSAFVSALQSPYISPRASAPAPDGATGDTATTTTTTAIASNGCTNNIASTTTTTLPSPTSCSCSHSDDLPSTSHTPPSERFDYPSEPTDQKSKFSDAAAPRISFSFPIPRVSFTKGSISPSSNAKLRSCDVYVGYHGQNHNLSRFCKWLKSELELQGMAAFVADRAKYSDSQSYEIADRIICSAAFGVTVVTTSSFLNPFTIEEVRFFAQKKNLIPLWFDTEPGEISRLLDGNTEDREWQEAFNGLNRCNEFKLEANESNWRSCISRTVSILKSKLGRKHDAEEAGVLDELPFVQNKCFVGREKELADIEAAFFGCSDVHEMEYSKPVMINGSSSGFSDGFADEESDTIRTTGRFISLEMRKCKEPTLEAWIEPPVEQSNKGRILQKQRSKHKRSKCSGNRGYGNANVICINGPSGVGKTELALEFAYRYSQRYKIVLWVGGGAKYFRQNILNLSVSLKLDVSAETEKERGRIRSFDEQEFEAFQRVKRDIFRDIPYLIIIDDLETEKEWWEGKDLHDLIPRNTGATHVIVTTRLQKVMSFEPIQLHPLSSADSLVLMRGKRKKDYSAVEVEVLTKFGERLGRLSFGLSVIGSLLAELMISPAELFESIESIQLNDNLFSLAASDDAFCRNNSFLMRVMLFCFVVLDQIAGKGTLASRMVIAGAWLAPAPISATLLAAAASEIPSKGNKLHQWSKCLGTALCCYPGSCLASQTRRNEVESALMLVKLGLARRVCRQPGCWIQLNPITQFFARRRGGLPPAKAAVQGMRKIGNPMVNADHLWASTFLVFGFKSEPPIVQLRAVEMVLFIKRIALPLAIRSFTTFSRCSSALELLKVCTNVLEEVEKSFVSQIQDWQRGSFCWKNKLQSSQSVDEYVWQDVTLLKATLLETRAKLLIRGGHFDNGEELCRTCISIRTVMLGHNHAQTLAAQETLAKLVRFRSKV